MTIGKFRLLQGEWLAGNTLVSWPSWFWTSPGSFGSTIMFFVWKVSFFLWPKLKMIIFIWAPVCEASMSALSFKYFHFFENVVWQYFKFSRYFPYVSLVFFYPNFTFNCTSFVWLETISLFWLLGTKSPLLFNDIFCKDWKKSSNVSMLLLFIVNCQVLLLGPHQYH